MASRKTSSELEHLRGIIRRQEATIRGLRKELSKCKPTIIVKETEKEKQLKKKASSKECPKCKSNLDSINLGVREMEICENLNCSHKKVTKLNGRSRR